MKILLDNCVPYRLKQAMRHLDVAHCKDMGWEQLQNGALIATAADAEVTVLLIVDKKIKFEHNLEKLALTILEIDSPDIKLGALVALLPKIEEALGLALRFRFISVLADGRLLMLAERTVA
jgi:hypothetical protein